jgi:hypothetical protein
MPDQLANLEWHWTTTPSDKKKSKNPSSLWFFNGVLTSGAPFLIYTNIIRSNNMLHDNTQALDRYNSLFNNQQYQAIADRLAVDLRTEREAMRVSDVLNCVTDTALSLCQHSHYADAWIKLATFCGQNGISIATIDHIFNYLLLFQQPSDMRADEFQMTAKALLKCSSASDSLKAAVSCASGVHGWRGRMAYDLLAACDYLVQAAGQLLIDGNRSYIRGKLQHSLKRITGALYEGLRHSERPNLFDFSKTNFPTEHDHR